MLITRETDYAIRCFLFLAKNIDRPVPVNEIAGNMQIPNSFLSKILQRLVRCRLLKSTRGAQGGFQLAKKPSEITLLAVMHAIQGPAAINVCAVDRRKCRRDPNCVVHPVWVDMRKEVERRLEKCSISDLMNA